MNLNSEIRFVNINEIDVSENVNQISYYGEEQITRLADFINKTGILTPLVLTSGISGKYRIITGYKRMDALLKNGFAGEIPCLILKNITASAELEYNITDNISSRKLNPIETALALKKLSSFYDEQHLISKFLPLFQIAQSEPNFRKYISLNLLIDDVKKEVALDKFPLNAAFIIAKIDVKNQSAFLNMIKICRMGANIINEMAVNIFEASMQHSKTYGEIFDIIHLNTVIYDEKLNTNQKTSLLRQHLLNLRRPEYEKAALEFNEKISNLAANAVSVNPYPYFEKDEINISFSVKSIKDFDNKLKIINKIRYSKNIEGYISND